VRSVNRLDIKIRISNLLFSSSTPEETEWRDYHPSKIIHSSFSARSIFFSVLFRLLRFAQSQTKEKLTAPQILEKVQDAYAKVNDAFAEFTQTVSLKYAGIEQTYTGSVMMKRGNKYRIESQQQTIVTDGKTCGHIRRSTSRW